MKAAGIICEYNPFHLGHKAHIEKTRMLLGGDCAVVCVMSGNFVQRGDFAVFSKHSRALSAVLCGADLVLELPTPYALSSAEGFARAGVHIIDSLGVCDYISFGSETGDINMLKEAAEMIVTTEAKALIKGWLGEGLPYAAALQKAADAKMGTRSDVFKSPNNMLGIEYLKALGARGSSLEPVTVKRTGGAHDGDTDFSAFALRKMMLSGDMCWEKLPQESAKICMEETAAGRGPISMKAYELAMLSRLRTAEGFFGLPGTSEGLDRRFKRYAADQPSVAELLDKIKTKRYAMSRLRRMLMFACLGFTEDDMIEPPPYIRVLAINQAGMKLIKEAQAKTNLPIITKPAAAKKLPGRAGELFRKEAAATDFYTLGYPNEKERRGGQEWTISPAVVGRGDY